MTVRTRFRPSSFVPLQTEGTLVLVLRNASGVIGHIRVGSALLDADWDGALSMLPSGEEADGIGDFFCDTPGQAQRAMDELAELGDVPFRRRDFEANWYLPRRGTAAVDWLLANRHDRWAPRRLTEAVLAELELLRRTLEGARRPGHRFHLVEAEPGEDLGFAGPELTKWPENNAMHLTRPATAGRRSPRK